MVLERPKVIYNDRLRTFVMWMHIDDAEYKMARAGVAVSSAATGHFKFLRSFRPNGRQSRDLNLFKVTPASSQLRCRPLSSAVQTCSAVCPAKHHAGTG